MGWVAKGRREYHGRAAEAAESAEQVRVAKEAVERQRAARDDEMWKAKNCRLCALQYTSTSSDSGGAAVR